MYGLWLLVASPTLLLMPGLEAQSDRPDTASEAGAWVVVDDGVMGGRSRGGVDWQNDALIFHGQLSLENNGGFSSIRRAVPGGLGNARAIRLTVRGDGRTYQLRLRNGGRFDGVAWRAEFTTGPEWRTHELPLTDFTPGFRGRDVPQAGRVDPRAVGQIGFLLGDKRPGEFRLEVRTIEVLSQESPES